jgi:hypothetical protein
MINLSATTLADLADPSAVKNEAAFLTRNQPVLFQPKAGYVWAWKKNISGPAASFRTPDPVLRQPRILVLHRVSSAL